MKRFFHLSLILALVLASLTMFGGFFVWQEIASHPDVAVTINGDDFDLQGLEMSGASGLGGLILGSLVAGLVLFIVVPLCLLIGLGLPLLIIGGLLALGLLAVLGVGAIVFSPLLLLVLLLWLLLRKPSKPRQANGAH
jgi:hypothetical protein